MMQSTRRHASVESKPVDEFVRRHRCGEFSTTRLPDGSGVLLDLQREVILNFNATGAFLIEQLIDGATVAELVDRVLERFEVDRATATADVERFTTQLVQAVG